MLVQHVAKRLVLKGATSADKTNQRTIESIGIWGVTNLCINFGVLTPHISLCPLCGSGRPGNDSVGARTGLLDPGSVELKSLLSNLLAN